MNLNPHIQKALARFIDPFLNRPYTDLGWLREVNGTLRLRLGYPKPPTECAALQADLQRLLHDTGIMQPVEVTWKVARHTVQPQVKPKPTISNVIAIGSGKGGVGKSTIAANIALALHQLGATVGILDADIYGPSQPNIFGVTKKPEVRHNQFIPLQAHGISMLSMGCLVEEDSAMIWRGPMVSGALQQLFHETQWPQLDYLILDLPPGTGDIQLTMAQKLPITGAVVVTTPQDLSLLDAKKAITMFHKVGIAVVGIVENMSTYQCAHCQHEEAIFGDRGGEKLAKKFGVELLGQLPLASKIRLHTDQGIPTVVAEPGSSFAKSFQRIAVALAAQCALRPIDYQLNMQNILKAEI